MTFEEEKEHVKREHRRVWDWLLSARTLNCRPFFDDNDEMYFSQAERRNQDAGISEPGTCAQRKP